MSQLPEEDFWFLSPSQHHHHLNERIGVEHVDVGFFGSVLGGAYLLLTIPLWLWNLYVEYLWNWDKHPFVKNMAASFRLFAILTLAPFALLTLLDVGAYVIARTLGVVETTKASTYDQKVPRGVYTDLDIIDSSETSMLHTVSAATSGAAVVSSSSAICVDARQCINTNNDVITTMMPEADLALPSSESSSASSSETSANTTTLKLKPKAKSKSKSRFDAETQKLTIPELHTSFSGTKSYQGVVDGVVDNDDADGGSGRRRSDRISDSEVEACFFSPSDERQLELSGGLLSSPTPSRQGSPGIERRHKLIQPLTRIDDTDTDTDA